MPTDVEFLLRISTAFFMAALIGLERQWHHHDAGMRTTGLVSTGAALFILISYQFTDSGGPGRTAAAIIQGIGFLGGGVILRQGLDIHGLTTAATIWCCAAIGVLCGAGYIHWAFYTVLLIFFANTILLKFSVYVDHKAEDNNKSDSASGSTNANP